MVWGSTFILLERVTHALGPVEIALWRFAGGAAALALIWWLTQRDFRLSRGDWAKIVFVALVFNAPPQIILPYLIAQGYGHSFFGSMVAPIPLITILVSVPLLNVVPTGRQLIGVLGGLVCMWLIVEDGFDRGMSWTFVALTLTIPISSAVCNTVIKWKLGHVPAVPLTTAILVIAGLSLAPLEFFPETMAALHVAPSAEAAATHATLVTWVYLFLLGVVGTGISTSVFVWMILKRGPLFAGMTTYVVPVLSLLWGTLDSERISFQQMIAIAGVLAMVALVQSSESRELVAEPATPPEPATAIPESISTLPLGVETPTPQPETQVA
jgi:drug/metabolite transporter (DMT)-like permease